MVARAQRAQCPCPHCPLGASSPPPPPRPGQESAQEALAIALEAAGLTTSSRDLHSLVHEQEETLEVVESNVEASAAAAEKGVQDLEVARDYVTACRWKGCVAGTIVVALVATLLSLHFAIQPPII